MPTFGLITVTKGREIHRVTAMCPVLYLWTQERCSVPGMQPDPHPERWMLLGRGREGGSPSGLRLPQVRKTRDRCPRQVPPEPARVTSEERMLGSLWCAGWGCAAPRAVSAIGQWASAPCSVRSIHTPPRCPQLSCSSAAVGPCNERVPSIYTLLLLFNHHEAGIRGRRQRTRPRARGHTLWFQMPEPL